MQISVMKFIVLTYIFVNLPPLLDKKIDLQDDCRPDGHGFELIRSFMVSSCGYPRAGIFYFATVGCQRSDKSTFSSFNPWM